MNFGIADDILIEGFDEQGRDQNATLDKVLTIYVQGNLKLNKGRPLQMHQHSILWQVNLLARCNLDP